MYFVELENGGYKKESLFQPLNPEPLNLEPAIIADIWSGVEI